MSNEVGKYWTSLHYRKEPRRIKDDQSIIKGQYIINFGGVFMEKQRVKGPSVVKRNKRVKRNKNKD